MLRCTCQPKQAAAVLQRSLHPWSIAIERQQLQSLSSWFLRHDFSSNAVEVSIPGPCPQLSRNKSFKFCLDPSDNVNWSFAQRASFAKASRKRQESKGPTSDGGFDSTALSQQMTKATEYLDQELANVRTGRASAGLLDHIKVQAYGQKMPLKAAANVSVRDAQTIVVTAFDPSTVAAVEKAIRDSALNLNPQTQGQELVVTIPRPTRETLAAMGKLIGHAGEAAKVKIRQVRKESVTEVRKLASEDDQKRAEKQVQQITDEFVSNVDKLCACKQKELQSL